MINVCARRSEEKGCGQYEIQIDPKTYIIYIKTHLNVAIVQTAKATTSARTLKCFFVCMSKPASKPPSKILKKPATNCHENH